jgi:organic radical activating enzyme
MSNFLTESKTFCIIPWIHIYASPSGRVLPCCIAKDHKGTFGSTLDQPLDDLVNSKGMKELRLNMLLNKTDNTCIQCYAHEREGIKSYRQSANEEHSNYFKESIANTNIDGSVNNFKMKYFDIRFSNICNFKCITCNSEYSSLWEQEDIKYRNSIKIIPKNNNRQLIDDILKHVEHIDLAYFAGGEPLITEEHYIILEEFIRQKRSDIRLRYNTNLSNFKFKNKDILDLWKYFKNGVDISASIDHYGDRAEYIRHGTNWARVEENLTMCKSLDFINTHINTVVSVFNYTTLGDFYQYLLDKGLYSRKDSTYSAYNLQGPEHMSSQILFDQHKRIGDKKLNRIMNKMIFENWNPDQPNQLKNCISWANSRTQSAEQKSEFVKFVNETDKIRGTDFCKTFPELTELLE